MTPAPTEPIGDCTEKASEKEDLTLQAPPLITTLPPAKLLFPGPLLTSPVVRYALCLAPGAGSTFELMAAQLLGRPHWVSCSVDTAARKKVCCDRLNRVNLYLGEKLAVEALLDESDRLQTCASVKRRCQTSLGKMRNPSFSVKAAAPCAHPLPKYTVSSDLCLVNYFRGTRQLTLKDKMLKVMRAFNIEHYSPQTFILIPLRQDDERQAFTRAFYRFGQDPTWWIVKSAHGKGGEGHRIVRSCKDAIRYVDSQTQKSPWIVQRYIDAPMLIHGRKFDIRVWVLVTKDFCIYLHRQGVMRTSSELFSLTNIEDNLVHLTNHCVQNQGPNFSAYEKGNEMFYPEFQSYLNSLPGPRRLSYEKDVTPVMKAMIVDVMLSIRGSFETPMSAKSPLRSFQFFGFDFMLDETFQLWLLEINGAPAITQDLAANMVGDIIQLVVDPIFPDGRVGKSAWGSEESHLTSNPHRPGVSTGFELLYPQKGSTWGLRTADGDLGIIPKGATSWWF